MRCTKYILPVLVLIFNRGTDPKYTRRQHIRKRMDVVATNLLFDNTNLLDAAGCLLEQTG
jgi:hypothetical protein